MASKTPKKKSLRKKSARKGAASSRPAVARLADPVLESAHDIWLAGLGAFALAQEEGGKVIGQGSKLFDRLVAEGTRLEKEKRDQAEDEIERVGSTVSGLRGQVEGRVENARKQVQDNWDRLENVFEDRVTRVMTRLGVPTSDDIRKLTRRVESLSKQVAELSRAESAARAGTETQSVGRATAVFHLLPKGDEWTIRLEDSDDDISVHDLKSDALDAARGVAQAHEPSRLVVHRGDGTIQANYSYGDAD